MQNSSNINNNTFTKKIGKSTYKVCVFFNQNSKENFNDKLLRVIKNDVSKNAESDQCGLRF